MVEFYTNYILQVLEKYQVEDIKKMQVKRSAAEAFTRHADEYLKRTAWTGYAVYLIWFHAADIFQARAALGSKVAIRNENRCCGLDPEYIVRSLRITLLSYH
jgi:hypothetical protein